MAQQFSARFNRAILSLIVLSATLLFSVLPASVRAEQVGPSATVVLPPITIESGTFFVAGQPFEVRGVNYIFPSGNTPGCPELHFGAHGSCPWNMQAIDADMERLRAYGVNTIRIFLNYYVFGGARAADPGYSLDEPLSHLDTLIDSANRQGIYVLPVLAAKFPQDQLTSAGYEQAARLHFYPVVQHLAGRPGLLGWDVFNEPDIGSPIDQRCWDWDNGDFSLCAQLAIQRTAFLTRLLDDVGGIDPKRPRTIGMAFAKSYFRPFKTVDELAARVDFFSFHYYDNDPYDSGRYAAHWYYGQGFPQDLRRSIDELHALRLYKPVLVTELGFPSGEGTLRDNEALRRDLRTGLETVRAHSASGAVLWPFQPTPDELIGDLFTR